MAYADLTAEQQNVLDTFVTMVRSWAGEQGRTSNHATVINDDYNNRVMTILGDLLDGDEIPNSSGLDGAEALSKAELVTLVSYIQGILQYNSSGHRGNLARACGPGNLIG